MKVFTSKRQQVGLLGEQIAAKYLSDKGFEIVETNYTKKIGEIDIVAKKNSILHFVEVKTLIKSGTLESNFPHETRPDHSETPDYYSPFENVTRSKMRKFSKTCEWYLIEKRVSYETKWQMDAIAVTVTRETKKAKVEVMWNIIM